MQETKSIIFICTGNIFRSMSAEYLANKYAKDNNFSNIIFSSAGTKADPQYPYSETVERLMHYGCNPEKHKQRHVTSNILNNQDLIICMTKKHQDHISMLGYDSILFNEIAIGKKMDLLDEAEAKVETYEEISKFIYKTVDYLHDNMPNIFSNCNKFFKK